MSNFPPVLVLFIAAAITAVVPSRVRPFVPLAA